VQLKNQGIDLLQRHNIIFFSIFSTTILTSHFNVDALILFVDHVRIYRRIIKTMAGPLADKMTCIAGLRRFFLAFPETSHKKFSEIKAAKNRLC